MPTTTIALAASGDDGYSNTGGINTANTYVLQGSNDYGGGGISENAWYRFLGVTVPPKSTINSAYMTFTKEDVLSTVRVRIYCEAADNPTAPTSTADYNGRSVTSAYLDWTQTTSGWVNGEAGQTGEIKTIIQEIIDRAGWASGNAMQLLIKNNGSDSDKKMGFSSYDHGSRQEPRLYIDYTPPSGANPVSVTPYMMV